MTSPAHRHRLQGLEPDNLLAFLALLGLLRALERARLQWHPRAAWDFEVAPLRPFLLLREPVDAKSICEAAAEGVRQLAAAHEFGGLNKLKLSKADARQRLLLAKDQAQAGDKLGAELWAALVSDVAIRSKAETVDRTPLCLLDVAQTSFLKTLADVCRLDALPRRSGDLEARFVEMIDKALFGAWNRADHTPSFRWDPSEDSRHAYRWAAPTDEKQGVEHGANVLAAVGLPILTVAPYQRGNEVRLHVLGGELHEGFSFAWPIWRDPTSLASIRSLLSHPELRILDALSHLGVEQVRVSRRISPPGSKYANFSRGRVLEVR